jgi:FG-GAP-like repeat
LKSSAGGPDLAKEIAMLSRVLTIAAAVLSQAAPQPIAGTSRPADIAFSVRMIDPGFSESVAVSDFNKDGRLDILSAEYWYEAPTWTKHRIREIPFNGSYIDNFSDLPVDVDGDGFTDIVQIAYFARRIVWLKNPGKARSSWVETEIDAVGPTEFAFLVDLNNDGKALEILPQFTGAAKAPLTWYELHQGKWIKHVVSSRSHGHGIGAGDVNGDKRNDILTPQGWLEAPADVRAGGEWTFHQTDWETAPPAAAPAVAPAATPAPGATQPATRPAEYGFMFAVDVNKDGRSDVVTTMAHSYGVLWFEQQPDGQWTRRIIDATWANAHASAMADLNADGQLDLIAAKRYFGRTGNDPAEREPMGIYWYQFRPGPKGGVEWIRHLVDYGGRAGGGLQMIVDDLDGDGDRDIITAGKTGLFVAENLTKVASAARRQK